jgi:hypothetical protein
MMGWDISIEEAENIADWTNQSFSNINDTGLASITAASDNLSNLGSEFNGATADAVKGYWSEVHGRMVAALSAAVQQLAVSYSEYFNELDSVDGSYCAHFVQDEIQSASNSASNMEADFDGTSQRVSSTLGDVSDIISIDPPSSSDVTACLSDISDFTSGLEQQVSQVESHGVDKANAVDDLISEADAFLQQVELNSARGGMSYVPADFLTTPAATALDDRLVEFNNSNYANADYAEEQISKMNSAMGDHLLEAKKAKTDEGWVKTAEGVGLALIGIFAIVGTAGAATPLVVAGAVAGGAAIGFGTSDAFEGKVDRYRGYAATSRDDLKGRSFNPVRDTIFGGNQEAYDTAENYTATACSVLGIVAPGVKAFAAYKGAKHITTVAKLAVGAEASGVEIGKNGLIDFGKDVVINPAIESSIDDEKKEHDVERMADRVIDGLTGTADEASSSD